MTSYVVKSQCRVGWSGMCGSIAEIMALPDERVTRELTREERAIYLHET